MAEFGGGGHPTAASATIREASLEVVEERVRNLLNASVKAGKVAFGYHDPSRHLCPAGYFD